MSSHHHEVSWIQSVDIGSLLGKLFQLAVSPFNWVDGVLEDVGEKVGRMLSAKASRNRTVEGQDEEEITIEGQKSSHGGPR
jgi:hypothetical protein